MDCSARCDFQDRTNARPTVAYVSVDTDIARGIDGRTVTGSEQVIDGGELCRDRLAHVLLAGCDPQDRSTAWSRDSTADLYAGNSSPSSICQSRLASV